LMALLALAMVVAGICRTLPVPYTVILVIIGMGLGEAARNIDSVAALQGFQLSPELVFFVFLPALIFEAGLNLDARQLVKDLAPILVLAIPALLISTLVTGLLFARFTGLELVAALLFGALISATDPVAVIALFKELGAPLRMTVLVEGESLINDATAIVVFGIILALAMRGAPLATGDVLWAVVDFFKVFLGGVFVGALLGLLASELIHRLQSGLSAILTLSLVVAYASFILAEHTLHVSGVMAAASAAVAMGVFGVTRMSRKATVAMGENWEMIALVCNSLLFLMVGMSVDPRGLVAHGHEILIGILLVLAARAATVYSLVPATTRLFRLPKITLGERHIMWWGGLKGGLAIAIVLSIPDSLPQKPLLINVTLGVVLFTLLVNAPTIRPLMSRIGLDRLTGDERSELDRTLADSRQQVAEKLAGFKTSGVLSGANEHRIRSTLAATFANTEGTSSAARAWREVRLAALRVEQESLQSLHEINLISQYGYLEIRSDLQTDREHLGQESSQVPGDEDHTGNPFVRLERAVLRRLREHNWAAPLLSRYQAMRLSQHLQQHIAGLLMTRSVLSMLDTHANLDARQREMLKTAYRTRLARRRAWLAEVRNEFPDFYRSFESRLFTLASLQMTHNRLDHLYEHGEIGAKVRSQLEQRIRHALQNLPAVGDPVPELQPRELLQLIPLLNGLPERELAAVSKQARPVTFLTGDVVIGQGERGDALYIITRGRLAVFMADGGGDLQPIGELGEGEFFGEMALLGDQVRTATVTATTTATLLRLNRRDILELAGEYPDINRCLEEARATRTQ